MAAPADTGSACRGEEKTVVKATQHSRQVWERFWDQEKPIGEVYANSPRILEQIEKLGPVAGKRILEVGAGSGRDGFLLADQGARIIFLDYAINSLALIQTMAQRNGQSVALVRGDAFRLPFKEACLDVVYHQGLLEHFTAPKQILMENRRVLKVGGHAIADVPQRYHPYTLVKHILIALNRWFAGWETEFSRAQLERLFRDVNLDPIGFYGDWMRPSFGYRAMRELLKKLSVRLPLHPRSLPGWAKLRQKAADRFRRSRWAHYTYMDIGVVGTRR
ncbi:class I SAM-dependent methyltransferase [bacterium]|nr:class I SAM-dependent methyltransferase [bacterium]